MSAYFVNLSQKGRGSKILKILSTQFMDAPKVRLCTMTTMYEQCVEKSCYLTSDEFHVSNLSQIIEETNEVADF